MPAARTRLGGARLGGVGTLRLTSVTRRGSPMVVGVLVAGLVYSWVAAYFRPFTLASDLSVALPVLVALLAVVASWRRRHERPGRDLAHRRERHLAGAAWVGLVTLLVAWELIAYVSSPRYDHPTLSTVADEIMSVHPGRALMFALWLALGWSLFLRRPAASHPPERQPAGQP